MSKKDGVPVKIFHYQFRLGSDSRDPEYIEKAAAYLDEKMRRAAEEAGKRSPFEIAILAAMEIAEEVLEERKKTERMLNQADERLSSFTERLESHGGSTQELVESGEPSAESDPITKENPSRKSQPRF